MVFDSKKVNISVALCTHNGEKYIQKQLDSIIHQTIPPCEIVVGDDNSTDATMHIIEQIMQSCSNIDIRVLKNKPALKTVKNFEKTIQACNGDYIFLSDQDDIWKKNKIERMIAAFSFENDLLLFSNGSLIDEHNDDLAVTLWDKWKFDTDKQHQWQQNNFAVKDLLQGRNYVTGATALISKNLIHNAIPITVPSGYYHDAWLALHAAAQNGLRFINENLIYYRVHAGQQVGITDGGKNTDSVIDEKNISFTQFQNNIFKQYPNIKPSYLHKLKKLIGI
ncbi:MAG: glycosyltransferase [Niabella sp.]